jgi:hypothetical protein
MTEAKKQLLEQPQREPSHATNRPPLSKTYERWMPLFFVLVPIAVALAIFYWAEFLNY